MRPNESFVEQPIRSLQTMLRVIAEDDNTLSTIVPDGIYGQETMRAVNAFQRKYNIPITGITDNVTWDKIVSVYEDAMIRIGKAEPIEIVMDANQVFRFGDRSPYIFLLQSMLTQLSFDAPSILRPNHNGTFDLSTSSALSEFQRLSDLPQTGELDKITWKHLVKQFALSAHHEKVFKQD